MAFLTPALSQLRDEVDARWPNRDKASDGWLGDPAHASRHSDHNPESDGSVDAIDITHDPTGGPDCNVLSEQIKDDPRIEGGGYVIWNSRIYNPSVSHEWRLYTGSNPHEKHMHVSVADRLQNDTSLWLEEEDELVGAKEDIIDVIEAKHRLRRRNELRILRNQKRILTNQKAAQADLNRIDRQIKRVEAEVNSDPDDELEAED